LKEQFQRLEDWNPFMTANAWPDADMLPLGRLAMGSRETKFTADEQQTLMTLWSIARSPLIMGGDLRSLDAHTLGLLTNSEVLAVNQKSHGNRPHRADPGTRIWSALADGSDAAHYLALFNTEERPGEIAFDLSQLNLGGKTVRLRDVWRRQDLRPADSVIRQALPPHGSALLRVMA
jgi:hypothetical protein